MSQFSRRLGALLFAGFITLATGIDAAVDIDAPAPTQQDLAAMAQVEARSSGLESAAPQEFNGDVRDLPKTTFTPPRYLHSWNEFEEPSRITPGVSAALDQPKAAQTVPALTPMPGPSIQFAGLGFSDTVTGGTAGRGPAPDANGDVGPTVYIQAVNDAFAIYDKRNGYRLAAFTENSLWSQVVTGTPCNGSNQGHPIVVHDGLADRWILTNSAFALDNDGNPIAPFYECMAVSKTGDPVSGGWYFYAVRMEGGSGSTALPAGTLPESPKFGIWSDCLYMGANGLAGTTGLTPGYVGGIFAAFNRNTMYNGETLSSNSASVIFLSGGWSSTYSPLPANILGTLPSSQPPPGTPEYFVNEGGLAGAGWQVRKYQSGPYPCGAGSTLSAATRVSQAPYNYPGDAITFQREIVGQRNTSNTLDSLGDAAMQKVQYRRIGNAESLWVVHTTCGPQLQDSNGYCDNLGDNTQPQWAQFDVTDKTISTTPVQQQIYAPDTSQSRWVGSLAVDAQGNMALGYSISSRKMFPSIAYSGRLASDPLGQLPRSETILQAGSASQTNSQRWGGYSSMSIDPSDDCTFWYTNQYYDTVANGKNGIWQTRIGAFKFPGCAGAAAKLAFTQEPNASYASNATITVKVSIEDENGNVVTRDTSPVTLVLSRGAVAEALNGTTTVNAVNGVATFSNLSVAKAGTGYRLNATGAPLYASVSTAFNITAGSPSSMTFATQPAFGSNVIAGNKILLVVHVQDAAANPVPERSVTLSLAANPGKSALSVAANPVTTDDNGNATFTRVALNKPGSGYSFKVTDNKARISTFGNSFNVTN